MISFTMLQLSEYYSISTSAVTFSNNIVAFFAQMGAAASSRETKSGSDSTRKQLQAQLEFICVLDDFCFLGEDCFPTVWNWFI